MTLFASFNTIPPIKVISPCSHNARILPLPNMDGSTNICVWITCPEMRIKARIKLYELFGPIDRNSNTERNKCIFPKQSMEYKDVNTLGKINKRKEITPHKLQGFLGFTPYWLYRIHGLYPLIYYQISTLFPKNTPQFNSMNEMGYTQTFQKRLPFQGGNTYALT